MKIALESLPLFIQNISELWTERVKVHPVITFVIIIVVEY